MGKWQIGQQQVVVIAKSLVEDARILIRDAPTSALLASEVDILFREIAVLKANGVSIVEISHRLEELIPIGDYITVLCDGVITGSRPMQGADIPWIVENMVGDASKDFPKTMTRHWGQRSSVPRKLACRGLVAGSWWNMSRSRRALARSWLSMG